MASSAPYGWPPNPWRIIAIARAQRLPSSRDAISCITDCAITGIGTSMSHARPRPASSPRRCPRRTEGSSSRPPLGRYAASIRSTSHERITEPWRQQAARRPCRAVAVALQQLHALADRLQHPELDAVVDQLGEVPRARRAGVHVAARRPRAPRRIGSSSATGPSRRRP